MGRFLMIGRSPAEPQIKVGSREQLFYLLAEAAEIEHNLMCCYLYAAFGLKTEADGLAVDDAAEIARWRSVILAVAVEEMTHLSLVANLTLSVGGTPHFGRPNFPIAAGYHPSGVVVELHPFDRATLDHFIYLERPEGVDLPDGEGFAPVNSEYRRETLGARLMPSAQDYLTVGHRYRAIHQAIENLSDTLGETALFVGGPRQQVGPSLIALPGLIAVTDRASALTALSTIIEQGEGSPSDSAQSHYRRFLAVRHSYDRLLADKPGFTSSRPVAKNPVMRLPPSPEGKISVDHPGAAEVMDLANAIYGLLLRALEVELKKALLEAAIDTMAALSPVAQHLTSLPASKAVPGVRAGMSFAMVRDLAPLPSATAAVRILAERLTELALGAGTALAGTVIAEPVARTIRQIGASLSSALESASAGSKALPSDKANARHFEVSPVVVRAAVAAEGDAIEVAKGACVTIAFEAKRCIHARFCVLQQPNVFRANVVGAWLVPDDATSAETLLTVAQTCPSGAINIDVMMVAPTKWRRRSTSSSCARMDPLRFAATSISIARRSASERHCVVVVPPGTNRSVTVRITAEGFRRPANRRVAILHRFLNPPTIDIQPQHNRPLTIRGNVEVISGTGRTIAKATTLHLCRCGASARKPHCDGSHTRVNFVSENAGLSG
jgi:uncharacterized Fe-S cluster protein YjdI/CDGSH-type Zn-finger protein